MKKRQWMQWLGALSLFLSAQVALAEGITGGYHPVTGDAELDLTLGELNASTHGGNLGELLDHLSLTWKVPRRDLEALRQVPDLTTGDIYMIAGLAGISGTPVEEVSSHYEWNRRKGWGEIAKEVGIQPGSPEFHRLKNGGTEALDRVKGKSGKADGSPAHGKKGKGSEEGKEKKAKDKGKQENKQKE